MNPRSPSINPALLAHYQGNQSNYGLALNPAQLLQQQPQQPQQHPHQQPFNMMAINPAALSSAVPAPSPVISSVLGISQEQFNALSPDEKRQKMFYAQQQRLAQVKEQQHQQVTAAQFQQGLAVSQSMLQQQLTQQQQQQQQQQFRDPMMNAQGISPMAMQSRQQQQQLQQQLQQQQPQQFIDPSMMQRRMQHQQTPMGMPRMPFDLESAQQHQQHQQQQHQHQSADMLQGMSMNRSSMGPFYERPPSSAGQQPLQPAQQQQPQQQHQQQQTGMMPPPQLPRNVAAMNAGMNINMVGVPGSSAVPGGMGTGPNANMMNMNINMNVNMGRMAGMRPPSRATTRTPMSPATGEINGYPSIKPHMSPQQQHQGLSNAYSQQPPNQQPQQQSSSASPIGMQMQQPLPYQQPQPPPTPVPGSPYRGAKRKVTGPTHSEGSPRVDGILPLGGAMGPPPPSTPLPHGQGVPRSMSTPGPPGMGDMNVNGMMRPPSAMSTTSSVNGVGHIQQHMPMMMQPPTPQPPQRQSSVPRQGSVPLSAGGRAGSMPASDVIMGGTPSTGPIPLPGTPTGMMMLPATGVPAAVTTPVPPSAQAQLAQQQAGPSQVSQPSAGASTGPSGTPPATAQGSLVGTPATMPALPPLPTNVNLNPRVTRVSIMPLATSTTDIPELTPSEIEDVARWMEVDAEYERVYRGMRDRMMDEAKDVAAKSWAWWEKGAPGFVDVNAWKRTRDAFHFDIRYPRVRKERDGRRKGVRREGLRLPRKIRPSDANKPELLVPIRLEFDVEHHKMRDTFVWNLNDPVVTPESFAQTIVEDYNLSSSYLSVIVKSIQDQLSDFKAHTGIYDGPTTDTDLAASSPVMDTSKSGGLPLPPEVSMDGDDADEGQVGRGQLEGGSERWWREWRKRLRSVEKAVAGDGSGNTGAELAANGKKTGGKARKKRKVVKDEEDGAQGDVEDEMQWEKEKPMALKEIDVNENTMHEELRILIKLDIIVGSMKLDDQFEWDLDNPNASPEEFAGVYTQELGLSGEFKTAIAHSIREQVQTYQKSLFLVGHPLDGSAIQDEELRMAFLPSLVSGTRSLDQVQSFTPLLNYMSDGEIERSEKERDKDMNKRRKRNTRGRRGIALPDREPVRTYRTPAIGFPELDPAALALAAAANAPVSRRAAAAAASVTIANMVASENGPGFSPELPSLTPAALQATFSNGPMQPPLPQMQPPQQQQQQNAAKDKKFKGHFKAPPCPPEVYKPRAQVTAPIPSTAVDASTLPAPLEDDPPPPLPVSHSNSATNGIVGPGGDRGGAGAGSGPGGGMNGSSQPAPDSKAAKVISARRAKELEREAKEKEFVDGQHPNYINGIWHCSNCGCPESIAIGRRKGPLGDKSQCGTCGKFWHRHRRPRPVEYNSDPDYHSGIRREQELAKSAASAKKRGGASALRQQTSAVPTPAETSEPQTPAKSNGGDVDASNRQSPAPGTKSQNDKGRSKDDDDRAVSPVSTASSASEPPLAQKVKLNGNSSRGAAGASSVPSTPVPANAKTKAPESTGSNGPSTPSGTKSTPPQWLANARDAMRAKYPNDRFELILRKVHPENDPEWRIKCTDCPGKLYTPGPGETLSNYEVHLKNRLHRQRVNDRIKAAES